MARVLVTGASGYIGSVLVPMLQGQGDEVIGLDVGYFESCVFGPEPPTFDLIRKDVRDLTADDIPNVDAVMHLAALSNDALGHLDPGITHEVNTLSTLRTAELARERGVERFLFSSSCSLYGAGGVSSLPVIHGLADDRLRIALEGAAGKPRRCPARSR